MSLGVVVSLFDESGNMVRPWGEVGYTCACFDWATTNRVELVGKGSIQYYKVDLTNPIVLQKIISLKPYIVFGFPECTHLAVSGTRHFAQKRHDNPLVQHDAVELCRTVELVGEASDAIWMMENPISMLSSLWREPDYRFHPFNYGGYLPIDDVHPRWPKYIMPRDAYKKTTCLWTSENFFMPPFLSVEPIDIVGFSIQSQVLGGKSEKTKQIRSETPRGFSKAVCMFNAKWISGQC